jgi:DNA-binding MarR family transcriptional regulator
MPDEARKLADRIRRVINRFVFLEKRSVFRLGEIRLHPSEIHLMLVVREQPDLNASEMAQATGVSIGAVSQTLARLERKGIITKTRDSSLKNRVTATFTETGKAAIEGFEEQRASSAASFSNYLAGLSETQKEVIESFLSQMEELLKGLE